MEAPLREWLPDAVIGKILIQRDESTACPKLFYSKLPPAIASQSVLLLVGEHANLETLIFFRM
jgi:uracil phosphoribosyltransferase